MKTSNLIIKIIFGIISVFIISFFISLIYAFVVCYPTTTAYNIGKSTGFMLKYMIKIWGALGLIVFLFRYFKNKQLNLREVNLDKNQPNEQNQ